MPLTENQAKNAKPLERAYKLADSEGLFLLVQPNGAKLWRMKYRFAGKEKLLSFGAYPALGIAAAREKRRAAKALLAEGRDPMLAKGQVISEGGDTFFAVANRWHENRKTALDPAHADRVWSRMERDVFPYIGQRPIQEITAPEVLEMIRRIESRGALDISRRAKQGVGQVFQFAIACGLASSDPTANLRGALKPRPRVKHMSRLPLVEFPAFIEKVRDYQEEGAPARSKRRKRRVPPRRYRPKPPQDGQTDPNASHPSPHISGGEASARRSGSRQPRSQRRVFQHNRVDCGRSPASHRELAPRVGLPAWRMNNRALQDEFRVVIANQCYYQNAISGAQHRPFPRLIGPHHAPLRQRLLPVVSSMERNRFRRGIHTRRPVRDSSDIPLRASTGHASGNAGGASRRRWRTGFHRHCGEFEKRNSWGQVELSSAESGPARIPDPGRLRASTGRFRCPLCRPAQRKADRIVLEHSARFVGLLAGIGRFNLLGVALVEDCNGRLLALADLRAERFGLIVGHPERRGVPACPAARSRSV